MKFEDEYVIIIIAIIGISFIFIPIMKIDDAFITFLDYPQKGEPISVGIFEYLRILYMPFLFVSTIVLIVTSYVVIRGNRLTDEEKLLISIALIFSLIPLATYNLPSEPITTNLSIFNGGEVILDLSNVEILPQFYLFAGKVPVLLVITSALMGKELVKVIEKIF